MNLEESIKDVIQTKLSDGTIEKIISEKLEKGIESAMDDLFRSYGDVGKVIKEKTTEVLIPAIENHDFSNNIVKLDTILTEIVNTTALVENKKLLENFKELMIEEDKKTITVSELFERYCKYVEKEVDTSNLKVMFEDDVIYETVDCTVEFEEGEGRSWSNLERANIVFECEKDEKLNFIIPVSRWKTDDKWDIDYRNDASIRSLRFMNDFEIFVAKLSRCWCKVLIDTRYKDDWVVPNERPEASYS